MKSKLLSLVAAVAAIVAVAGEATTAVVSRWEVILETAALILVALQKWLDKPLCL